MEECKNNWRDGTCPECGECHYMVVRRERFVTLTDQFADAQREIERLRTQIVGPNADYEAWQRAERLREQAEAQVKALQAEVRDEREGKFAMHKIAGEWEDQARALTKMVEEAQYREGLENAAYQGEVAKVRALREAFWAYWTVHHDCDDPGNDNCRCEKPSALATPPAPEEGTDGT